MPLEYLLNRDDGADNLHSGIQGVVLTVCIHDKEDK